MTRPVALAILLAFTPILTAQSPLPKVPDGFKVEIVLQAPDIEAPTALCVAPNGDVYFAEDPMDMSGPPTKNIDKIWMLKGGDPKKKILIADQMWAVMGLEIVRDKLYVVHAPHVTVFTLDADGKPKERKELFDDLGPPVAGVPGFNDHIPSGIRMGMDGWLYVSIGDKGIPKMTRKEKDQGSVHVAEGRWRHTKEGNHISLEGGGVIRFRPDGSGLEVFASGTRNHLDVPMDEHDRIFVRDNTDDGDGWNTRFMYLPRGGFMGYPWAFKQHPKETLPAINDFGGGAPCGGYIYCDDGLPEKYKGRIFHCEWGQGKVWAVKVVPDGAGFKYVDQIAFMDSTGTGVKDFRPFTLRPTADGRGFYVTDWGLSGWLQKVKVGRIFKVTYVKDDVKPKPRGKDTDSMEELIKSLDHPAFTERLRAQRALTERSKELDVFLGKPWETISNKEIGEILKKPVVGRHMTWVSDTAAGRTGTPFTFDQFSEVWRVVGNHAGRSEKPIDPMWRAWILQSVGSPEDAMYRLQAAIASRVDLGDATIVIPVVELAGKEHDVYVRHALVRSLKEANWTKVGTLFNDEWIAKAKPESLEVLCDVLTEQYEVGATAILNRILKRTEYELRAKAVEALARTYKDRKLYAGTWWGTRPEQQKPPARVVEWEGTPLVRDALVAALGDKDAKVRQAAVVGLINAADPATLGPLTKRFAEEKDEAARVDLLRAISGLPTEERTTLLAAVAGDSKFAVPLRVEAIAGLERVSLKEDSARSFSRVMALVSAAHPIMNAAVQARALEALGVLKCKAGRGPAIAALESQSTAVRKAAITALASIVTPESADKNRFLPLLEDKDSTVRTTAIQALGTLKAKDALPALIKASTVESTQFDAINALAKMPDKNALSAYLTGLASKNADLRKASASAIAAIREDAAPLLQQLVKGNEIPATLFAELRTIYLSYEPIPGWALIGPFPDDGAVYPPEKEIHFDESYQGAEKKVSWRLNVRADLKQHGRVNLAGKFSPSDNVVVYGYTEIEAPEARDAELLVGSDDTIVLWVNGKKVHSFDNSRGWSFDQDKVRIKLEKGKNTLLVRCGNKSGPWEFSVAVSADASKYAFLQGGAKKLDLEAFRAFARKNPGDPEKGKKLFNDVKGLGCVKCHSVGGEGGKVGPDLAGIALKYKREDLMTSLLEPSKVIAQGYETIVITTDKGKSLVGVFKGETADVVNLMNANGEAIAVPKKEIDERTISPISTMPSGLNDGMTLQDFADLIAFLEARREEKPVEKSKK